MRRQVFNSHLIKTISVDITHSGSPKKETTLQVHDFASRIQAIHKCIAKLYQNVHQLSLQSQKWLEESCEELHATVQELEVAQEVLLQQNKELEIQLQECIKIRDCKQIRAVNHQLLSEIVH